MRPNRNRTKTTVYLSPDDVARCDELKKSHGHNTRAAAIRHAIRIATTDPTPIEETARRLLAIAGDLKFVTPAERAKMADVERELRSIMRDRPK